MSLFWLLFCRGRVLEHLILPLHKYFIHWLFLNHIWDCATWLHNSPEYLFILLETKATLWRLLLYIIFDDYGVTFSVSSATVQRSVVYILLVIKHCWSLQASERSYFHIHSLLSNLTLVYLCSLFISTNIYVGQITF